MDERVSVLVVERRSGTSLFPRAVGQNQRTMELLGFGGIAKDVPTQTPSESRFRVRVAASLRGPAFHEEVSHAVPSGLEVLSPARVGTAGQDKLEPLLRQRAEELGADLRFDTELVSFDEDDDGVTAVLRGRRDERTTQVRADYLVAADGNRSAVREALGVERHGSGSLGHNLSIIFDADLGDLVEPDQATLHVLYNEHASGVFITIDRAINRHLYSVGYDPASGQSPADFTTERCTELIRLATELPDLEPEIRAVRSWEMAAAVADRFRVGRVLLAGDAAKVTPPSGGFGGNTAVGDAYDLAWKLTAVLDATAGPGLLDTYDAERRPIAERVVAEALRLLSRRGADSAAQDTRDTAETTDTKDKEAEEASDRQRAVELTLGFRYRSSAVLIEDDDPADTEDPYRPTGRPGFRAPHVWLRGDGGKVSTVELFGDGFTLLAGPEGALWGDVAEDVVGRLGMTLRTHVIGQDLGDTDGEFLARYGIGASGVSLVRPDGVVAWRTADQSGDPAQALLGALTMVLAR
ncbi:2-polyprenyl-6-methoxyphenol hydroxylase [Streptoalloteichus tenebrarius]|uniref:2-polyprenyl-6-methoxyphenol hydroxylase n=1 Tax=Streptoalloteichus tenebrarius (strain ATCC 17920 / DSM 40477 / JCM 4838 / CBS 697.72 / NBRC 16177 / NCIMB 11028 / NRRL B-12390 / A12253. 1 / ISP 5477) TaxID=1933 RepID=A0ABT1HPK4_STRSD|nr:FAD-dependent monooxygenase [Streptoalloteichus tenebrarius]MCP2257446.1 2-polyprenyl-6-methoxyphenol hydroxylase [Streptoalloteichus tenebrarius]BFE98395.1 FAD-dependent monooxygenase [Streptoalloteichus tenebrarius]